MSSDITLTSKDFSKAHNRQRDKHKDSEQKTKGYKMVKNKSRKETLIPLIRV